MESRELIEAVRARLAKQRGEKTASDYAVAKTIGISKQAISDHKHGRSFTLSDEAVIRAATFVGVNEAYALACIHAERSKSEEVKSAWERIAHAFRKRAAAAAVAFCIMGLAGFATGMPPISPSEAFNADHTLYVIGGPALIAAWGILGGFSRGFRWLLPPFLILAALSANGLRRLSAILYRVMNTAAWTRAICAAVILTATPAFAEGVWSLQFNGASIHPHARHDYNEHNTGLGIQYTEIDGARVRRYGGGTLINSMSDRTWYAGATFGRRLTSYLSAELFAGALTYPSAEESILPAVLPVVSIGSARLALHVTYIPPVHVKRTDAILFQLSVAR